MADTTTVDLAGVTTSTTADQEDMELLNADVLESNAATLEDDTEETKIDDEDTTKLEDDQENKTEIDEEEELEKLKVPFDRPTLKDIKEKYPNIFKDFPQLRDGYFRELQYTAIFPTIEDAKEAFDDVESFSSFRESALAGDPGPVLDSLEAADKKALGNFARNFLPKLYQKNADMYREVTTPILENLVRHIHSAGVKNDNEDLRNSALNISKYLFDTDEIATGKKTTVKTEETPEKNTEKIAEQARKLNLAYAEVQSSIHNNLKKLILADLDPNNVFNPWQRRGIIEEVIKRIGEGLEKDPSHMKIIGSRWKRAELNGYTDEEKTKIVTAYLARAKSLIPITREKVRAAALGTKTKVAADKTSRVESKTRIDKELPGGRAHSESNGRRFQKVDYSKMSDDDILNS